MTFLEKKMVSTKDEVSNKGKKFLQFLLKTTNFVHCIFGIATLLFSSWMFAYTLENYREFLFSAWFLWVSLGTGITYCVVAIVGFIAAMTRIRLLLSGYMGVLFLLLLMEILVGADIFLNAHWQKDFPNDPTRRFEDFVAYVIDHISIFKFLCVKLIVSQVASFFIALLLRALFSRNVSIDDLDDDILAGLPFLNHKIIGQYLPYAVGHPHYHATQDDTLKHKEEGKPFSEEHTLFMPAKECPPY